MRRFSRILSLTLFLVAVTTGFTAAQIEWSASYVDEFIIPEGNLIPSGDLSDGMVSQWKVGHNWVNNVTLDFDNYITGMASALFTLPETGKGRVYVDRSVDPNRKYRVGWIGRTEDLTATVNYGFYFRDGLGAWVNLAKAMETLGEDYFGGLNVSSIVLSTPNEIDLGGGRQEMSGTLGWYRIEFVLDLPKLAKDCNAGQGQIVMMRIDHTAGTGTGKVWLDSIYLVPVD